MYETFPTASLLRIHTGPHNEGGQLIPIFDSSSDGALQSLARHWRFGVANSDEFGFLAKTLVDIISKDLPPWFASGVVCLLLHRFALPVLLLVGRTPGERNFVKGL